MAFFLSNSSFVRTKTFQPQAPTADDYRSNNISPETVRIINLKELVANKMARTLFGRGFKIDIVKDKEKYKGAAKRLNNIIKRNNLAGLMFEAEKRMSINGTTYMTIHWYNGMPTYMLSEDGDFINWPQGYVRAFHEGIVAVIFKMHIFDMIEVPCIEIWTRTSVKRIFLRDQKTLIMPFHDYEDLKLPQSEWLPEFERHNLGFLPVWQFKNLLNYGNKSDTDDTAVPDYQLMVDQLTSALYKELEKNQTRVILAASQSELRNLEKDGSGVKNLINDYIIQLHNHSDMISSPVQVLMGDPKIEAYMRGIKENVNAYFEYCGLNGPHNLSSGSNQSATEILSNRSLDMETIRNKRKIRIEILKDIIEKTMIIDKKYGYGDIYPPIENIEISIPENIAVSTDDVLRRIQAEVPLGTMSKAHAISLMNDISVTEAQDRLERVWTERKKEMEMGLDTPQNNMVGNVSGPKQNHPLGESVGTDRQEKQRS